MRDLRRLEDEIHASTSTPRRRSRCETSPDAPRARDVVGFVARDDDDGCARASLRDARAAIEDAASALAVDEETEMRRGRALGALDATATDATGDEETTDDAKKRAATDDATTDDATKKIPRRRRRDGCDDDDGCDDIDPSITTPVVPRETRSTRASTTPT